MERAASPWVGGINAADFLRPGNKFKGWPRLFNRGLPFAVAGPIGLVASAAKPPCR